MFLSTNWTDYEILDAGNGAKLERWGDFRLLRPDPQAIWPMDEPTYVDAHYIRSTTGGGHWEYNRTLPESWSVRYNELEFIVRPTGFKHTGLFPEQAVNWDWMGGIARDSELGIRNSEFRVLNLFAYTGGATCALLSAGASVVHVDAAKGMVAWAKENVARCGLADRDVRFIIDDAMKFVQREQRRGKVYEGILMDPPSYGRGPNGEMWKIEDDLYTLVRECVKLLSPDARFFLINSYTTGLAPSVLSSVLSVALRGCGGNIEAGEVGLPITRGGLVLPCGASGRWSLG